MMYVFAVFVCLDFNIFTYFFFYFQVLGSRGDRERQIEKDTDEKIRSIEKSVQVNKQQALNKLLEMVYDIKPELHENLRL